MNIKHSVVCFDAINIKRSCFECKVQWYKFKCGKYCKVLLLSSKYSMASLCVTNIYKLLIFTIFYIVASIESFGFHNIFQFVKALILIIFLYIFKYNL